MCRSCIRRVQRNIWTETVFFWKTYKFDEKVCTLSKKIGFQQEDWNRVVKTSFFSCPGKPWRKTSLPGKIIFFFSFFGLSAQEKSDFCLELLAWVPELKSLSPQEKFDQNLIFFEKKLNFCLSMWTFKLKYSFFGFQTSAGLSKFQVTCLLKLVFQRCSFFSKIHNISSTFSVLIEAIRSPRNYCWKFFKTFFTCPC